MLETIFSWSTLWWILMPIYIVACLGLIAVVLLQKGKGTGFAGAFGVGPGSETVFGPRARKSLPVRLTYIMATLFMVLSLGLSLIVGRESRGVAPEAVAESSAAAAQDEALDELFGDTGGAETTPAPASDTTVPGAATLEPAAPAESTTPEPATDSEAESAISEPSDAPGAPTEASTPAETPAGQ